MKNLILAFVVLSVTGCTSGNDLPRPAASQSAAAPDTLTLRLKGTKLHDLAGALAASGVRLEVSPALVDRTLDLDGSGQPVKVVLEQIAASAGARLEYTPGTYRMLPIAAASESPLPETSRQGLQPHLLGALPTDDVKRVIDTSKASVRFCYEKALTGGHPELQGKLSLHWIIEPTGKVDKASVTKGVSTLEDAGVEACVLDVVRSMVFPEPTGGGVVEVNYPFVFTAE